jgi:hypothetical protein
MHTNLMLSIPVRILSAVAWYTRLSRFCHCDLLPRQFISWGLQEETFRTGLGSFTKLFRVARSLRETSGCFYNLLTVDLNHLGTYTPSEERCVSYLSHTILGALAHASILISCYV